MSPTGITKDIEWISFVPSLHTGCPAIQGGTLMRSVLKIVVAARAEVRAIEKRMQI